MRLGKMFFSEEERIAQDRLAQEEQRREQQVRMAMASGLPEIPRNRLKFGRYQIEDERTGDLYAPVRGWVDDVKNSAIAFYFDKDGSPRYLELPPYGVRTVDELEARRVAKEQARAARLTPRRRR